MRLMVALLLAGCTQSWHYDSLRHIPAAAEAKAFVVTDNTAYELDRVQRTAGTVRGVPAKVWAIEPVRLIQPQQHEAPDAVARRAGWLRIRPNPDAVVAVPTAMIRYAAVPITDLTPNGRAAVTGIVVVGTAAATAAAAIVLYVVMFSIYNSDE